MRVQNTLYLDIEYMQAVNNEDAGGIHCIYMYM